MLQMYKKLNDSLPSNAKNIKMIACDMDGTILNDQNVLSEITQFKVKEISKLGIKVLLATGRMVEAVEKHLKLLGTSSIVVADNGAVIKDISSGKKYFEDYVDFNIAKAVLAFASQNEISIHFNCSDGTYAEHIGFLSSMFEDHLNIHIHKINSLNNLDKNIISILLISDKKSLIFILEKINNLYKDKFDHVLIPWFEDIWQLQFLPANTSKDNGVFKVAEMMNIKKSEIMSFGDSYNDINLIKQSGIGIAMDNAVDDLKHAADYITLSNKEDGVAYVLDMLIKSNQNLVS
jgi:Cof subfamily protein (haloacid dehalogenase superfamily)